MKGKRPIVFVGIVLLAVFLLEMPYASEQTNQAGVLEVFQMKADYKHKKGIVAFTHEKHIAEYEVGCGECHHDDDGQPLNDLKMTDEVQSCISCHLEPGERPKGKDAPKLTKEERLAYHAEALHYNCKDCHKAYNKKNKTKKAPTTCAKCHPKKRPAPPSGLIIKG